MTWLAGNHAFAAPAANVAEESLGRHPPQSFASRGSAEHRFRPILPNLLDALRSLLSVIVVVLFVFTFIAQPFRIPSGSMERTLLAGDFLLVDKSVFGPPGHWAWLLPYRPVERRDIVVFHFPLDPSDHLVKRVIGIPGDRIRLLGGAVYLDGREQTEPYTVFERAYQDGFRSQFPSSLYTDPGVDAHWWIQMREDMRDGQLQVPDNDYFVLGDNRNYSRDSRYWGFVPKANVEGLPLLIYFSLAPPSGGDDVTLPDDKLGHGQNVLDRIFFFARWDRTFSVVR